MQYYIQQNIAVHPVDGAKVIGNNPLTLEEMQAQVGGYIEMVPLSTNLIACGSHPVTDQGQVYMIVNEEGLHSGLPYNPYASQIAGQRVVGNALFVKAEHIQ